MGMLTPWRCCCRCVVAVTGVSVAVAAMALLLRASVWLLPVWCYCCKAALLLRTQCCYYEHDVTVLLQM